MKAAKKRKRKAYWCVKVVTFVLLLAVIFPYLLHLGYQSPIMEPNIPVMSQSKEDVGVYWKIWGGIREFYQIGF